MEDDRGREAYASSVERLSADMGRLVGVIEAMLTGDESTITFSHFSEARFAAAAWKVGGMFFGVERDIYDFKERWLPLDPKRPGVSDPAADGVDLFEAVMAGACRRWEIPLSWVRNEDDGRTWIGHAFPENFPARDAHVFLPGEVKRLRLAHRLTTIPVAGGGIRPTRGDSLEERDRFAYEQDQLHHTKRGQIRLEMWQQGWGKISEANLRKIITGYASRNSLPFTPLKPGRPKRGGNSH